MKLKEFPHKLTWQINFWDSLASITSAVDCLYCSCENSLANVCCKNWYLYTVIDSSGREEFKEGRGKAWGHQLVN